MEFLGDKLAGAQSHVSHWVGSMRRSLHEAMNLVTAAVAPERAAGEGLGQTPFKRPASFRHLASRSRESFRQFSVRSQHRLASFRTRPAGLEQPRPPDLDHLTRCFGRPAAEARDTDVLVQGAHSRYGTWEDQRHSRDSFVPESSSSESSAVPAQKPSPSSQAALFSSRTDLASSKEQRSTSPEDSSPEAHSADGASASPPKGACPDFSFLEQTPRLDLGALKSRVLLSKRRQRHRAPISHALRRSAGREAEGLPTPSSGTGRADCGWMFRGSTEEKPTGGGGSEEEEEPPPAERLPSSQPRLPLFPGLDPSALKAQLRKRHELEGREEATPAPLCKSPKGPFQAGVSGGRALMTAPEKEERLGEPPPRWLKELKSRKKQGRPRAPSEEDSG